MNEKVIPIIVMLGIVMLLSLVPSSFGANEQIVNGGFESLSPFGWTLWLYADEITVTSADDPHSGSAHLVMGGIGVGGTGRAHAEQTLSPAVYAHGDLTLWAKGYNAPSTLVVWVFYEYGGVESHTKAVSAEYSMITVEIDKTQAVEKIRIATYDEVDNVYTAIRFVDDVSMCGGLFVVPELPLGAITGLVGMFAAVGVYGYTKRRRSP